MALRRQSSQRSDDLMEYDDAVGPGGLTELTELRLMTSGITGTLPASLINLTELTTCVLNYQSSWQCPLPAVPAACNSSGVPRPSTV